ncbi:hypothetical protein ACFDR9_003559 [Janthinobacterium sp. CG_23.3]
MIADYEFKQRQLAVDRNDLDFGKILAMALMLLVVLTTTHLENFDLIMATMRHNRNQYRCTFDQWGTKLDGVARTYCEYLIDGDFGTNVCRYLFYFKFFASDNFVLFATGFYDRVHDLKPHQMLKEFLSKPDQASRAQPGELAIIHGMRNSVKNYSQTPVVVVCRQLERQGRASQKREKC